MKEKEKVKIKELKDLLDKFVYLKNSDERNERYNFLAKRKVEELTEILDIIYKKNDTFENVAQTRMNKKVKDVFTKSIGYICYYLAVKPRADMTEIELANYFTRRSKFYTETQLTDKFLYDYGNYTIIDVCRLDEDKNLYVLYDYDSSSSTAEEED